MATQKSRKKRREKAWASEKASRKRERERVSYTSTAAQLTSLFSLSKKNRKRTFLLLFSVVLLVLVLLRFVKKFKYT